MQRSTVYILFTLSLGFAWFLFLLTPASSGYDYHAITISEGEGFQTIAATLGSEGLVRSPRAFMIYALLTGAAHQLKPGNYGLSAGSSTPAILGTIEAGPSADVSVVIPEGATVRDIDTLLARAGILPPGSVTGFPVARLAAQYPFLADQSSFEGFLFPDTYRFFKNSETETVLKKFLDTFTAKAWPVLAKCQLSRISCGGFTVKQVLTIASLLEKEAPKYHDRQIIAGIIDKRLSSGMGLHIDATITYAKCAGAFTTCADPKVYRTDLGYASPYNTYVHAGLPPGPIANPGLEAIQAALSPVATSYWYYLSDPRTGRMIYSETLDEQNNNRAIYLGV
ncbi:MAG: endolytic transglycosylase MltG [Patescibacteria group bacterium]|nr:endolytic transglycosylase MltG [Patescibacteria group bacterium]